MLDLLKGPGQMTEELLAPLAPNEKALMPLFQTNIDDDMLREIAEADYGEGAEECLPLLQEILRSGVAESAEFRLREVLELSRWGSRSVGLRGSWLELFSCTALLQLAPQDPDSFYSECEVLAVFANSAIELGLAVTQAGASVLAWRFLSYPGDQEERVFLAFAILLMAAHLERGSDRGAWLKQLTAWVVQLESDARSQFGGKTDEWLLGLTSFRQKEGLWRYWARRILVEPSSPHPREADEALRELGKLVGRPGSPRESGTD